MLQDRHRRNESKDFSAIELRSERGAAEKCQCVWLTPFLDVVEHAGLPAKVALGVP